MKKKQHDLVDCLRAIQEATNEELTQYRDELRLIYVRVMFIISKRNVG